MSHIAVIVLLKRGIVKSNKFVKAHDMIHKHNKTKHLTHSLFSFLFIIRFTIQLIIDKPHNAINST